MSDTVTARDRLFFISALALFTAALNAALRAGLAGQLKLAYLDPLSVSQSATLISSALGVAFTAFGLTLFVASSCLDAIGMRRMLLLAAATFVGGNLLILIITPLASGIGAFWTIWGGMLLAGMGWGFVEATINPLTATLYPDDTTHRMNVLHAWWPAGLVTGGLIALCTSWGIDWRLLLAIAIVPAMWFGAICLRATFPATARVQQGVAFSDMFGEVVRRPSFLVWFGTMFLTAATELAPGQWVDVALTNIVGMRGIILLIYVSGLMFVMRHFAGTLAHRLSPIGLLLCGSIAAAAGLYLLSLAASPTSALIAATIWGIGVCYMWPTMLATVADRYPRGGSFAIGLVGAAGALSIGIVLPMLGQLYDKAKLDAAGGADAFAHLSGPALRNVEIVATAASFRAVAAIPVVLVLIFTTIWLNDRRAVRKR